MGRSRKSFDRFLKLYRFKDTAFRLTRVPVLKTLGKKMVDSDTVSLTYIPVNVDIELPQDTTVAPLSIIEHFIKEASHHVLLNRCPCRSENDCQDYDPYFGCTFIGEAAREIDPDVGRHVSAEEALEHLRQATDMGLVSCLGKFKGDAIMLGLKDHHRLMTICHCCPCCCISTAFPLASKEARDLLVKLEGVNVEVTDECNGCGLCVDACIFNQIEIVDGRAVIGDECKGCGRCAAVCKRDAIRITIDDPAYIDRCVERIGALVDVD